MFKDCFVDVKELGGKDNLCLNINYPYLKELSQGCLKIVLWM